MYNRRNYLKLKIAERRRVLKQKSVEYKGGKCQNCGYNKCLDAMAFHHIDEKTKKFEISSGQTKSWARLVSELDKCELLCHNCHSERHYNLNLSKLLEQRKLLTEVSTAYKEKIKNSKLELKCDNCACTFVKYKSRLQDTNFCSLKCKQDFFTNGNWPSNDDIIEKIKEIGIKNLAKEIGVTVGTVYRRLEMLKRSKPSKDELEKLLWEKPTVHIAQQFKVSDKAVEKWARKYGLIKPPRGYWSKLAVNR